MPLREFYFRPPVYDEEEFSNPSARRIYEAAWLRATRWRVEDDDIHWGEYIVDALADIAAFAGLVSGMAARDALVYYMGYFYGHEATPETEPMLLRYTRQYLNWPTDWALFDDTDESFIWPSGVDTPPHHMEECACNECRPCGCMRAHCTNCYPDGPPPGLCNCSRCAPPEVDDQGEDDDWEGPPAMPDPIPGRCRFGVEVEFNGGDRHNIAVALQRDGIACIDTNYGHDVQRYWKMTTDSSVTGGECVSPILRGDDASIEQARAVLRLVKAHGGSTGNNVGLHVHLDVTPFGTPELKALAHNMRRAQMLFCGFVPEHRYNRGGFGGSGWAKLMTDDEWDAIQEWVAQISPIEHRRSRENRAGSCPTERYVAFNFNSLLTYGTIECRLLGHTLNTVKFRTWVRTLQALMEASRQRKRMPRGDILTWLAQFGLESEHAEHFRQVVTSRGNEQYLVAA